MNKTLVYLGLAIILSIFGFLIFPHFLDFSFSQLNTGIIRIQNSTINRQFLWHIIFSLLIGAIPIFYLLVEKTTKLEFINKGVIALLLIIGCGIVSWRLRIFQLNLNLRLLSKYDLGDEVYTEIDLNNLNFNLPLFIGFLVGSGLSILIFKNKRKKSN